MKYRTTMVCSLSSSEFILVLKGVGIIKSVQPGRKVDILLRAEQGTGRPSAELYRPYSCFLSSGCTDEHDVIDRCSRSSKADNTSCNDGGGNDDTTLSKSSSQD